MRIIKTIPALALATSLASVALLLAATEGAVAKKSNNHKGALELREVHHDHDHDGKHDHDHNHKHNHNTNTKITTAKAKEKPTTNVVGRKSVPLLSSSPSTILVVVPVLFQAPVQPSARASVISASSQAVRPWAILATALHRLPAYRAARAQAGIRSRTVPAQHSSRTEETPGWRRLPPPTRSITPAAVAERTHRRNSR